MGAHDHWHDHVRLASKRIKGFGESARKVPYFSSALLVAMGIYIAIQGWRHQGRDV